MKTVNKKGFTLIEVVLVLAIGGLIFLLAFLAFQQVQRNRRDTQRRSDAARILSEISNVQSDGGQYAITAANHTGTDAANTGICDSTAGVLRNYLCQSGRFTAPSGRNYSVLAHNNASEPSVDQIKVSTTIGAFSITAIGCDGTALPEAEHVVRVGLESGVACRDSR